MLRVFEQASRDGRKTMPLKHRKAGEYPGMPRARLPVGDGERQAGRVPVQGRRPVPTYSSCRHEFKSNAARARVSQRHSCRTACGMRSCLPCWRRGGSNHRCGQVAGAPQHQRRLRHLWSPRPVVSWARTGCAERVEQRDSQRPRVHIDRIRALAGGPGCQGSHLQGGMLDMQLVPISGIIGSWSAYPCRYEVTWPVPECLSRRLLEHG